MTTLETHTHTGTEADERPNPAPLVLPTSAEEVTDFKLLMVDPDQLVIGPNARHLDDDDLDNLDMDFVEDLGERGNYAPIIARYDTEGQLVVRDGQLRTHGLRAAKRIALRKDEPWRKALVLAQEHSITDERAAEIERLVEQHGANFLRFAMSAGDSVRTVQRLLELGIEQDTVGKKLKLKPKEAATLVAVAQSERAAELVEQSVLDWETGPVVAEFERYGDAEAVETLAEAARTNPRQFHHIAQRLRDERRERLAIAETTAELTAQGLTVIDRPASTNGPEIAALVNLRPTPRSKPGTALKDKKHSTCPGHAAYLVFRRAWRKDDEDTVDVHYVCTDFQAHGHAQRYAEPGKVLVKPVTSSAADSGWTPEKSAYRDKVIKNGKEWDSATVKRLEALKTFAGRKSLPQTWDTWLTAMRATSERYATAATKGHQLATELLGWKTKLMGLSREKRIATIKAELLKMRPERARVADAVIVFAAFEEGLARHKHGRRRAWEQPTTEDVDYFSKWRDMEKDKLTRYALAPVEELVLGPAEPVDAALVAAVDNELDTPVPDSADQADPDAPDDVDDNDHNESDPDTASAGGEAATQIGAAAA